jgi:hypothetical protein
MYITTMTNTMQPTIQGWCNIYARDRPVVDQCMMRGKMNGLAKIIIVKGEKDYEGFAVYDDGTMYHAWSNRKASLMARMKREVKKRLDSL